MKAKSSIPVLRINDFQINLQSDSSIQYHEIFGSRLIEKAHQHDFFLFLLFENGGGTHTIDFITHNVSGHQLHLLFPGQVHTWSLTENTRAFQIMISKRIFEIFATSLRYDLILYQKNPVLALSASAFQQLLYEFKAIQTELNLEPRLWDIISSRCRIIAQLASREAEDKFAGLTAYQSKPILVDYLSLIDTNFRQQRSVAFYADKLNITPNYLNILCKKHFHTSATSFIHNRLILEAKRLLLTSKNSVKEISYELGFYDLAYFSKFFKMQTGASPREFRLPL